MRQSGWLQARCQKMIAPAGRILREKFSRRPEIPHGFELPRTLSCKPITSRIREFLTPDRDAQSADVAAAVETSKRDRVLAGRE